MMIAVRMAFVILLGTLPSAATLLAGSLTPAGGETFKPGTVMTIEWVASDADNGQYDIYFSRDGGRTWPVEFAEGWQGSTVNGAKNAYRWTIPANTANTTTARIRVCQLSGGHCTQPGVFTLVSGDFTISNSTSIEGGLPMAGAGPRFDFTPETGTIQVEFHLAAAAEVSLRAYDAAGKLAAEIPERSMGEGTQGLSLSSQGLEGAGPLVFRLKMGSETASWTWQGTR